MPIVSTGQLTLTDLTDGIRSDLSKPVHVLPASTGGIVSSYVGSGTQIRVYQGSTELTYDAVGTANGTWKINTPTATNIAVGTITDSGTFATVGDHSGVADATDTSTIVYNIAGKSLSGESFTLTPTQTFSKARAGAPGANAVVIDLSNDNASVPANFDGSSPNFTGVSTTLSIFEGGVDTTASWTIAQALSSGLTGTASGTPANRTFTPSGLTVDSGIVTFTATRAGYANQTIVFTITKAKAGTPGTNSTVYDIRTSQATVKRLQSGSYSNSNLAVSLFSTTGTGAPTAYAGRFIIATSTDGTTYTDRYTSAGNESSYTYSILANVNFIRVSAYLAGGTTTLIDQEIIPVADDGVAGQNNATITLYQRAASAPTAPAGNYTYTFATRAITEATGSWTAAIPAGTNPLYVTTANASSNAATATITFSTPVLFVQDGAAGANARAVSLTIGAQAFAYNAAGTTPSPTSTTATATAFNTSGTVNYEFVLDGTSVQNGTTNTYTYTPPAAFADMPDTLRVNIRENSTTSAILASDTIAISGLRNSSNGIDALTPILSNAAHTLPTATNGTITYTGSGTNISLFEGTTELVYDGVGTANGSWKVVATGTNITPGGLTDGGNFVAVAAHSAMTSTTASVSYNITGKRAGGGAINITVVQTLSRAIQGATGDPGTRGSKQFFASGTSWSDSVADAAITSPNSPKVLLDQVTISGTNFSQTRYWNGTSWIQVSQVVDGNLLVNGTVGANALTAGTILANVFNVGSTNFQLDGAAQGAGKGALFVKNGTTNMLTAGYLDANTIGISLKDAGGNTLMQSSAPAGTTTVTNNFAPAIANSNITVDVATGQIAGIGTGSGQSVANNRDFIIRDPGGALSVNNPSSVTGALKIRLPQLWTSTMMRFTVDIYEYAAGLMCTMEIGGYNYWTGNNASSYWTNVTARVLGGSNVEYPVYFGNDGTKCCVWIGTNTETWSYPQVRVKDFLGGHSNSDRDLWSSGWAISFDTTAITPVTTTTGANQYNASVTDTLPGADWSKTARRPGNLSALTGNEGIQNSLITVNGSGQLTGIGTGENTVVQNTLIQVDANGNFVNAGATGNGTSISNTLVARRLVSAGSVAATIQGNSIIRASGNEDYNSFVYGEAISGSCFAEAIITPNSWTMIAFDTVATTGSYLSQDFVVHANPASSINIYQNGTGLVTLSAPTAGHLLRVTYDGVKYQVFVNGTQVGANYAAPANQRYFPIFNAYNQNIRYSGLNYGPYTDNAWASVGGTGRPADNATVGAIAGTNLLRSNATVLNDNDIITSAGTAAGIANQTAWATYSTHAPADVAPKTVDWLGPRTYQDVSVAANGSARWLRVARVDAPGGRGTATVSISGGGGGVTPGKLTLEVSVDWTGLATLTILSASRYFPAQSIRLSRTGTQTYLDLLATPIGTGTGLRIEVIPNVGSGGIWQVNYVDNPSIGSTDLGSISIEGTGGTKLVGTVILDGGTVTSTLSDAAGGIKTNGTQAIDSSGNAFDVLAGATKAVAERGANITETRTASGILNQAATATSSDFSAVTGSTKPEGNATNDRYFDRRNTNQAPNWYLSNYNVRTAYEFKDASVLGVPGSSPGFWGALVTTNDYADFSGGEIKQRFTYGSGVTAGTSYVRTGSGTTWTAWLKDFNGYLRPTFDANDLLETGTTLATVANFKTSSGTAAGILNQGALATRSTARIGTDIVDDDGTTVLTAPKLRNNRTDGSMAIVAAPEGGSLTLDAPNTGAIRIGLPAARRGSNTMMAFRVTIYDYDPNTSVIYEVGGYNYETGWINTFARALGPTNAAKPVRFGRDGTRDYIWIGNLDTVWQYPKVSITDLRTGYSNFAHGLWETGWQVVLTTSDFAGVVATYLEPNAGDMVFGINAKEAWNGAVATLPNFKTSQGTASGILNQAATATSSDFASVTGTTKPANNATVGAVIGTNLTGTFTETEVGNRFNSNSIGSTYIKDISASKITTGTISASASVTVGSSGGNAALLLDGSKRQIIVRDASNNIRVKIGDLSV